MHCELPPSSSDKWLHCHGWLRLNAPIPNTSTPEADEGTLAHSLLEHFLLQACPPETVRTLPPKPDGVSEEMEERIASVAEWVLDQPGYMLVEQPIDYGGQFGFVGLFGTADVVLVEEDRLTVGDLKYGFGVVEVERNPQLLIYLSGVVAQHGRRDKYRLAILQPRGTHTDGPVRLWEFGNEELDVFNLFLSEAIHKNYRGGELRTGDHCRKYCKALGRCPAAAKKAIEIFRENPID